MQQRALVWTLVAVLVPIAVWAVPEGPAPGTPEWQEREAANYAKTSEAPDEQAQNPYFQQTMQEQGQRNQDEWEARWMADPSWLGPPSNNGAVTPLGATWGQIGTGDPTRYPLVAGPNGSDFYDTEVERTSVVYYDEGCARIAAIVWTPAGWTPSDPLLPGVVIQNGSVQAVQTFYWWQAQALVRAGYVVMTFDPRGQGRSDNNTPTGEQGSNANSEVFFSGMVNAIDYFRATPVAPYPHNVTCGSSYPTVVNDFNPLHDRIDRTRLGIMGHSLGASGVSAVQGYPGSRFAFPDAGGGNPVDVLVAWDSLSFRSDGPPRVPAMGQSGEYGLTPAPFDEPPDPEADKNAFRAYVDADVPVVQFTIQGSTHYEWSLIPGLPTTSWCADTSSGSCLGGWGNPMAEHYGVAWLDRWLKVPGEPGYADADARLLADDDWCERYSFYLRSARSFPDRSGAMHVSEDIRADCLAEDLAGLCGPAPAEGCRQPTVPGKAQLQFKDKVNVRADQVQWKWIRGDFTPRAAFGGPLSTTSYQFCVYDGDSQLVFQAAVPAGDVCRRGRPCWKANSRGYRYIDRELTPDGVQQLKLKEGSTGKAQVQLKGKGALLALPALPIQRLPVTAQLVNTDGECWQAVYSTTLRNTAEQFKAKSD